MFFKCIILRCIWHKKDETQIKHNENMFAYEQARETSTLFLNGNKILLRQSYSCG